MVTFCPSTPRRVGPKPSLPSNTFSTHHCVNLSTLPISVILWACYRNSYRHSLHSPPTSTHQGVVITQPYIHPFHALRCCGASGVGSLIISLPRFLHNSNSPSISLHVRQYAPNCHYRSKPNCLIPISFSPSSHSHTTQGSPYLQNNWSTGKVLSDIHYKPRV